MTIEMATRTIQFILAPVIMVTACGILLNGILIRYAARSTRIRSMTHERLDLVLSDRTSRLAAERLIQIDNQLPIMLRQLKLAHASIWMIYCADAVFIADMFIIALSSNPRVGFAPAIAVTVFLIGTGLVLIGIFLTAWEVSTSKEAIVYEVNRVLKLEPQPPANSTPGE